eukprot:120537-Rhodomonas_salina.1
MAPGAILPLASAAPPRLTRLTRSPSWPLDHDANVSPSPARPLFPSPLATDESKLASEYTPPIASSSPWYSRRTSWHSISRCASRTRSIAVLPGFPSTRSRSCSSRIESNGTWKHQAQG